MSILELSKQVFAEFLRDMVFVRLWLLPGFVRFLLMFDLLDLLTSKRIINNFY